MGPLIEAPPHPPFPSPASRWAMHSSTSWNHATRSAARRCSTTTSSSAIARSTAEMSCEEDGIPSGKHTKKLWKKSPFLMGKSTNSMAMFNRNVSLPGRVICWSNHQFVGASFTMMFLQRIIPKIIYFQINGGTPIAGWFISWRESRVPKWMI